MSAICGVYAPGCSEMASPEALDRMLAAMAQPATSATRAFVDQDAAVALGQIYDSSFVTPGNPPEPAWLESDWLVAAVDGSIEGGRLGPQGELRAAAAVVDDFEQANGTFPAGLAGYFSLAIWDRVQRELAPFGQRCAR